ncbi:MAG TPA: S9 family peptidase [Candidatus Baltobacteraceae bacterium]|jgi:dipeptidyl aminopeptidase/acylaminoacyl peptidase
MNALRAATAAALVLALTGISAPAGAQQAAMAQVLHVYSTLAGFPDISISPDGSRIAFAKEIHHETTLWIQAIGGRTASRLTAGNGKAAFDEFEPAWSPDGTYVAFFSDARSKDHPALYIADANGGSVRRLNALGGLPQRMTWSPDGRFLSFLYIAHPHRKAGALMPGARQVGVIGSVVDEQQLATVDVHTGTLSLITPSDDYVYEYAWSPDNKRFALTYARGSGTNNWWIAKLATVDAAGGSPHDVLAPSFQINAPAWSPDGTRIAFIGGIMSDFGSVGGDVYDVSAAGGEPTNLTPNAHFSATAIHWSRPQQIIVDAHVSGALHLLALDVSTGATTTVIDGDDTLRSISYAHNADTIALVRSSWSRPAEIWAGTPSDLRQVTDDNEKVPNLAGRAVSLTWKSDRFAPQGWLIAPPHVDPGRKYPMVMIVHGGPSSESLPSYDSPFVVALTSSGYYVFEPNPRGSYGQGEAYTQANIKDFGYGDWRDDLSGIDAAIAAAPIDGNRLGLFGWSYGGYMAMWAETQTQRFKAIVAGAGVVNWQSYYGQNDIDQWMIPFFGASVYDDPAVYAKSSPITFIKNSHTPVLILQGERDEEVPAPQSFEFYHAMKTLGVPSELVVYADEGHSSQKPKDRIDTFTRTVEWFDRYLK